MAILWLEDKPELSIDLYNALNANFSGKIIQVKSFAEIHDRINNPEIEIRGFIIDLALNRVNINLEIFGILDYKMHPVDSGFWFIAKCLRNIGGESPYGQRYVNIPIIILTSSDKVSIQSRYRGFFNYERQNGLPVTTVIPKPNFEKSNATIDQLNNWFAGLPVNND